jgi:hypothetical protein
MKVLIVVAVLVSLIALALAGRALYQISHQCVKQCDWGDKRCADMCGARHFCPAHPDGI